MKARLGTAGTNDDIAAAASVQAVPISQSSVLLLPIFVRSYTF